VSFFSSWGGNVILVTCCFLALRLLRTKKRKRLAKRRTPPTTPPAMPPFAAAKNPSLEVPAVSVGVGVTLLGGAVCERVDVADAIGVGENEEVTNAEV
jgi:hypothetical protein